MGSSSRRWGRINGFGAALLGISKPQLDGTVTATEWLTAMWLPIIPLRRQLLRFVDSPGWSYAYVVISEEPFKILEILHTYLFSWLIVPAFMFGPLFLTEYIAVPRISGTSEAWPTIDELVAIAFLLAVPIFLAKRHDARCQPPQ